MAKTHKLQNIHVKAGDMRLDIDFGRMERNLNNAQFALDTAVMNSMEPFMPMQTHNFIDRTRAESMAIAGTGKVCAAAKPFGRFLYEGKTMVDEKTGSPWAREFAKKVLVSQYGGKTQARPDLQYGRRGAVDHWFEKAKQKDLSQWRRIVAEEMAKK